MKLRLNMITLRYLLLFFVLLISCSSDGLNNELPECTEQEQQVFVDRAVVATFTDVRGTIVEDDGCPVFAIKGGPMVEGRNVERLFACNLPDSYKRDGLEVIFSGDLYETFETENICAQFFLLTQVDTP